VKKPISIILIFSFVFYLFGCSSNGLVDLEEPESGASVRIKLVDGTTKHGLILKKEGQILKYVDSETNEPEDLEISRINKIEYSDVVYDFSGKTISENDISDAKGSGKTIGYSAGGFLIGGLIGFGIGAIASSATDEGVALVYPIVGFGIAGGILLGFKGSDLDRQDAINDIRVERYKVTQKELQKELDKQKKEIEKKKKELKKLKEKKKDE